MKIKQNLHTHSIYDDGKDTIDDMVQTAIEKGFTVLGFSGHGYNRPLDDCSMSLEDSQKYKEDVLAAREKYKDQIEIFYGIEQDSMNPLDEDFDYKIGSVHYVEVSGKKLPVDYSREKFEELLVECGGIRKLCEIYYQAESELMNDDSIDIVGHIDLISKYNENEEYFPFEADWYLTLAKKAIDAGIDKGKIFEMNTGAISRRYRKTPYPHPALLQYMADHGAKLCVNTDCHNRNNLDQSMDEAIALAKEAGFTKLYTLTNEGFVPEDIDRFAGESCSGQSD